MGSPVSPITCNLYMEFLEQEAIATAPLDFRPRLWKRYVDDILEIVKENQVENLKDRLHPHFIIQSTIVFVLFLHESFCTRGYLQSIYSQNEFLLHYAFCESVFP